MAGKQQIHYEVESLVGKRFSTSSKGKEIVEYLVQWKGFGSKFDTWEPVRNLANCKQFIKKYESARKKEAASTKLCAQKLINKSKMTQKQVNRKTAAKFKSDKTSSEVRKGVGRPRKKPDTSCPPAKHDTSMEVISTSVLNNDTSSTSEKGCSGSKKRRSASPLAGSSSKKQRTSLNKDQKMKVLKVKLKPDLKVGKTPLSKKSLTKTRTPIKLKVKLNKSSPKSTLTPKGSKQKTNVLKVELGSALKKSQKSAGKSKTPKLKSSTSPKKKWEQVDNEISFSSDDEKYPSSNATDGQKHKSKNKTLKSKTKTASKGVLKLNIAQLVNKKPKQDESSIVSSETKHADTNKSSTKKSSSEKSNKVKQDKLKSKQDKRTSKKDKKKSLSSMSISIIETDSDSDDDILYTLSDTSNVETSPHDVFAELSEKVAERSKSEGSAVGSDKSSNIAEKKGSKKSKSTSAAVGTGDKSPSKLSKNIRLLDSLKQPSTSTPVITVRPVSPTPVLFSRVKPAGPSATVLPAHAPHAAPGATWMVVNSDGTTPASSLQASLPISPASMSYKVLLENLPHQLHPKKGKGKVPGSADMTDSDDVERRVSVRASEAAFKYKEILIKKCHKYTQIWLNTHTKMKNALSPTVMQEIASALNVAMYDDSNLVMLSGLGNVFCSGVDLHFLTAGDRKVNARKMVDALRDLVRKFITFPKLLVAVVPGTAIGLGATLLPLCDIVYASDKASFYMPYAQLGQTPEGCATYTLPSIVGTAMASELLIGGRRITALEACQLGLVSQVYWPTSMMQEVIPRVQHMALLSGKVLETTKLLMRSHQRTKLDLTNESECNLLVERWPAADCQKAMELFVSNEKNYTL